LETEKEVFLQSQRRCVSVQVC